MDKNDYMEEMKKISSKLKALHNTIQSLYAALESENIEKQALDVIECIGFCVNDIKNYVSYIVLRGMHTHANKELVTS